jgi:hypothetical protein
VALIRLVAGEAGFQRYAGRSPMAYLRDVRLARAHEDLRAADPSLTTVGRIAHRWASRTWVGSPRSTALAIAPWPSKDRVPGRSVEAGVQVYRLS